MCVEVFLIQGKGQDNSVIYEQIDTSQFIVIKALLLSRIFKHTNSSSRAIGNVCGLRKHVHGNKYAGALISIDVE